jgi:hypothetical protein
LGLQTVVEQLQKDDKVKRIVIVTDGHEGYSFSFPPVKVFVVSVARGAGISAMWNTGLLFAEPGSHVAFINDDVALFSDAMGKLCAKLDEEPSIGLVCPHYAQTPEQPDIDTTTTCRSRYDGTGGIAGFCFVLANDLAAQWRWPEQMKWWWGDDMLVDWVNLVAKRRCVITSVARCYHGDSVTIKKDPPHGFAEQVELDKKIYESWRKQHAS